MVCVRAEGFTLVELVMVIIILGVLAVAVVPKFLGRDTVAAASFRGSVTSALRYAQKTSVSHRRLVCATFTPTGVSLMLATTNPATACTTNLASPDGRPYASQDSGVTVGGYPGLLYFQPWGTVTTDGAGAMVYAGSLTISGEDSIQIAGATGYVQ